jgi:predicted alpha/beta-fold hydrolase
MTDLSDFRPPLWLRPAGVQTVLASNKLRALYTRGFEDLAQRHILDVGDGLTTTCYINAHPAPQGIVILFHGWLGQPQSSYVMSAAKTLFYNGFSTARVTLPEHAESALMNAAVVPITRQAFLSNSVKEVCAMYPDLPAGLMGFSLGGNCVLRIARELDKHSIPALKHVVAVSPVIDPHSTGTVIDKNPLIRRYFIKKFSKLYQQKLDLFPELSYLAQVMACKTTLGLTRAFVNQYPEFASLEDYFRAYRIEKDDFLSPKVGVTLLTAMDDPIVSPEPAAALSDGPMFERIFTQHGGHNGFFERFPNRMYSEHLAVTRFRSGLT